MRRTFLLMATAVIALSLLAACPSGGGTRTSSSGGGSGTASSGGAGATPPPAPVIIPAGTLGWQGWQLGANWEDAKARLGAEMKILEAWAVPGELGMVTAIPTNGDPYPEHALVFTAGQLVGYNYSNYMPIEQFGNLKAELVGSFGEPAATPPEWALATPYFEGYKPPSKELQVFYWGDEPAHSVLLLMFNSMTNLGIIALANADHFNQALQDMNDQASAAAATGQAPPAAADGEVPGEPGKEVAFNEIGKSPFFLDGYNLGTPYEIVKADFPATNLLLSNTWASEGQTGMFRATPSDLSKPYPDTAAWFLSGGLAGYIRTEEQTGEDFIAATDVFDKDYGPAEYDPPAWLAETPCQQYYPAAGADCEVLVWQDEQSRSLLIAQYDHSQGLATYMLLDAFAYPQAKDMTMASLNGGAKK